MDPVSVAGLGLGVVSLAFQLFAGCIQGFVILSTAHNLYRGQLDVTMHVESARIPVDRLGSSCRSTFGEPCFR